MTRIDEPVVILAGGLGTRLRSAIGADLPKAMAPIGERPFLAYLLSSLEAQGVSRAILAVAHKKEAIQEHFGDRFRGIAIEYSAEDEPRGTGPAIRDALQVAGSDAFVMNGDTYFPAELPTLRAAAERNGSDIAIALAEVADTGRYGRVHLSKDGRVTAFLEKQGGAPGFINAGTYYVRRGALDTLSLPECFSFEKDVLEANTDTLRIDGVAYDRYFIDIGIPEDYERGQRELPAFHPE